VVISHAHLSYYFLTWEGGEKMKNKLKFTVISGLLAAVLFTGVAFGAGLVLQPGFLVIGSNPVLTDLVNGTGSTTSGINFGTKPIDVKAAIPSFTATDYVAVSDYRGRNSGWSFKVSATNLTAAVLDDTTAASTTDTVAISIPISSILKFSGSELTPYYFSKTTGLSLTTAQTAVANAGVTILAAPRGRGAGAYTAKTSYTLDLPNYLPVGSTVVPQDTANSAFTNDTVTELGLFEGSYSTTITYTSAAAP
jgi:hypothetical protein